MFNEMKYLWILEKLRNLYMGTTFCVDSNLFMENIHLKILFLAIVMFFKKGMPSTGPHRYTINQMRITECVVK